MLFVSPLFMFLFLPVFVLSCIFTPPKSRNAVLLTLSLIFYSWAEPLFIFIVIASALTDWYLGQLIDNAKTKQAKLLWMWLGVLGNLGILGYFKYMNFFVGNIQQLIGHLDLGASTLLLTQVGLPLGVSFITFEKITYLVDIFRKTTKPTKLLSYFTYIFLFPKLIAGPIVKYQEVADQLEQRTFQYEDLREGFSRFVYGLAKKVFIADVIAATTDSLFGISPLLLGTVYAWLAIVAFIMQIYFDFAAYSDMAIGLARMAGFRLKENFDMPFTSASMTEFWRRWHISFSSWIFQYVYLPLNSTRRWKLPFSGSADSKKSPGSTSFAKLRSCLIVLTCGFISGLWHGANWTFVIWGLLNGILLIMDHVLWKKFDSAIPRPLRVLSVFMSFTIIGVLFRCPTFEQAIWHYIMLFTWHEPQQYFGLRYDFFFAFAIALLFSFRAPSQIAQDIAKLAPSPKALQKWDYAQLAFCTFFFVTITRISAVSFHPFIYFKF